MQGSSRGECKSNYLWFLWRVGIAADNYIFWKTRFCFGLFQLLRLSIFTLSPLPACVPTCVLVNWGLALCEYSCFDYLAASLTGCDQWSGSVREDEREGSEWMNESLCVAQKVKLEWFNLMEDLRKSGDKSGIGQDCEGNWMRRVKLVPQAKNHEGIRSWNVLRNN